MSPAPRPLRPSGLGAIAPTQLVVPWMIVGAVWGAIGLAGLAWCSGRIVAAATGAAPGPDFGTGFVNAAVRGDWAAAFGAPHPAIGWVFGGLVAVVALPLWWTWTLWQSRRRPADDPLRSLASAADLAELGPKAAAVKAVRLRADLAERAPASLSPDEAGEQLGRLKAASEPRPILRSSWEDVTVAIMGTRSGKTTALAVPRVLQAPGAVVATSNRADLWASTAHARAERGRVWLFDPQAITRSPQGCWWNPLRAIVDTESADRVAAQFVQPLRKGSSDPFWPDAAQELITALLLAASLKPGGSMRDVGTWITRWRSPEPAALLEKGGYDQWRRALTETAALEPEMRTSIYGTAKTALKSLNDPRITAWITPPKGRSIPELRVDAFPLTADALYLLSKDGAGSAAPLVAALTDQVFRSAVRVAEAHGGRLKTPMCAILDECANVCPINDLPVLYSHFGGRSILLTTILQNYRQGVSTWGADGMGALWSTANIILIGAGINDPQHCKDLSDLVGPHDVTTVSVNVDSSGSRSTNASLRTQPILTPADIREIHRGEAILLASGHKPAQLELLPWYAGPEADRITADTREAIAAVTGAAGEELEALLQAIRDEEGLDLSAGAAPTRPGTAVLERPTLPQFRTRW